MDTDSRLVPVRAGLASPQAWAKPDLWPNAPLGLGAGVSAVEHVSAVGAPVLRAGEAQTLCPVEHPCLMFSSAPSALPPRCLGTLSWEVLQTLAPARSPHPDTTQGQAQQGLGELLPHRLTFLRSSQVLVRPGASLRRGHGF